MKKVIYVLLWFLFSFGIVFSQWFDWDDRFRNPYDDWAGNVMDNTDISSVAKEQVVNSDESLSVKLSKAFGLNYEWDDRWIKYIKTIVNYFLWLASFIALAVIIYWFYMAFLSDNSDEQMKKAKKYMTTAIVALFIMWVSWFIISLLFEVYLKVKW